MTAVEYLIKKLSKSKYFQRVLNEINNNSTTQKDVLKEALLLEKSQLMNFFCYAYIVEKGEINSEKVLEAFKNYYDRQQYKSE
jgi:hypothetical protein